MPAELPWRLPSTRISVYFSGRPRSLILDWAPVPDRPPDRKSTRLNSSHLVISYAVFCLKKKKKHQSLHILNIKTQHSIPLSSIPTSPRHIITLHDLQLSPMSEYITLQPTLSS